MSRLLSVVCSVALTLACADVARAAVPWSSPIDVGPAAIDVLSPRIVFSPRATGFASWLVGVDAGGVGLDPGGAVNRPVGAVYIAGAPDGRVTVAWSSIRGAALRPKTFPAMATRSDTAGRFAPAQQVAASGAVGGLAVRPDGAAIVTFARSVQYQETDQALAAIRLPGAAFFGVPEAIADPDVASPPTVAFDPTTGRPTAAWPARPIGVDPSRGVGRTAVLRFATRAAP